MDDLMTPDEVAEFLKVQPRTVRDWIRRGELPAIKLGRGWRVEQTALQHFLDARRTNK